jgi:hypothetical protein
LSLRGPHFRRDCEPPASCHCERGTCRAWQSRSANAKTVGRGSCPPHSFSRRVSLVQVRSSPLAPGGENRSEGDVNSQSSLGLWILSFWSRVARGLVPSSHYQRHIDSDRDEAYTSCELWIYSNMLSIYRAASIVPEISEGTRTVEAKESGCFLPAAGR